MAEQSQSMHRSTFDVFKSNVCHQVKDQGDLDFIIQTLESGIIRQYADQGWYAECLYLLAMVDYLSRENGLPLCNDYDDLRQMKLKAPLYPFSVAIADAISNDQQRMKKKNNHKALNRFIHRILEVHYEICNQYCKN